MTESTLPNETLQSQLSAFIDGELPTAETELLARRLARDPELQQAMSRYVLLGEALRSPLHGRSVSKDFSARVAAVIEESGSKDAVAADTTSRKRSNFPVQWLKPVAGVAVAASVALVAVLAVRSSPQSAADTALAQRSGSAETTQLAASASTNDSYVVPAIANAPSAPIPAARLTNYVVAHSEFTSPLGQRNMLLGLLSDDQSATSGAAAQSEQTAEQKKTDALPDQSVATP